MRICKRGLDFMQVINADGDVTACSWTGDAKTGQLHPLVIGNLLKNSVEEIRSGKVFKEFIDSLLNETYEFCPVQCCPYLSNGTIEEYKTEYTGIKPYPSELSISYERDCNYVCKMCRKEPYKKGKDELLSIQKIQNELDKVLNKIEIISANGYGELFASKNILDVLSHWEPDETVNNPKVLLETNGGLFDEKHWNQIKNLGKYPLSVAITILSFDNDTYQYLSGTKVPIDKLLSNLQFVKKLREEGVINYLELATVIMERNFREMPEFVRKCLDEFGADRVRLRSYFPTGSMPRHWEWFFDPRNPAHPYYDEYCKIMADPVFKRDNVMMWSGDELSVQGDLTSANLGKEKNYDTVKDLLLCDDVPDRVQEYLRVKGIDSLIIYGIGVVGRVLVTLLRKLSLDIKVILDNYTREVSYEGIPIEKSDDFSMGLEDNDLSGSAIIVTPPFGFEEIKSNLQSCGYENEIIHIDDIIAKKF